MLQALLQRFERYQPDERRLKVGLTAGIIGVLSNLLLFVAKLVIGLMAHSVSIMADAMNSLSDTVSSVLTIVGFKIAAKPADQDHPFGHERFEYVSGFIISLLITFVGVKFLDTSVRKILHPENIQLSWIVFVVLFISIVLKIGQGGVYWRLGNFISSNTLKATAQDSFNDVLTTAVVLVSASVEWLTGWRIDGYVGLVIALYIFISGIKMTKSFIDELLGQRPTDDEIQKMRKHLDEYPMILGYHDLLVHDYGPKKHFASVHIEVDSRWSLEQAHDVIDEIEYDFRKNLDVQLVCHLDPVDISNEAYQAKRQALQCIVMEIDPRLAIHDVRVLHEQFLFFDLVVPKECKISEASLMEEIQRQVYERVGDYKVKITFDHNYLLK